MSSKRDYDSTVARIAGNLLSGHPKFFHLDRDQMPVYDGAMVAEAVSAARAIVAETRRSEPATTVDAVAKG